MLHLYPFFVRAYFSTCSPCRIPVPVSVSTRQLPTLSWPPCIPLSHNLFPLPLLSSQPAKLLLLDSGQNTDQRNDRRSDHSPKLNLQHILVVVCLRRRRDSRQHHQEDKVSTQAVVLVQLLRILLAAVDLRHKVLRHADKGLDGDQDVGEQAKDGVGRLEVYAFVRDLVVLDDDEAGDGRGEGEVIETSVGVGALLLLLRRVRGLQDEHTLSKEQDRCRVEQLRDNPY